MAAQAEVKLILKAVDNASQTIGGVGGKLKGLNNAFEQLTGISLGAAAGIGGVVAALKFSVQQAAAAERAQAQLAAVIKSTGGAAGMTADAVNDMAARLSDMAAVDDDLIISASNVLLTFTRIGSEAFPDAMKAALNLSAAMGQDLQTSVVQIGKALNDPIAGIGALSRVGIQLTADQKELIKSFVAVNDVASAQRIILGELETQFGGTAAAAGGTFVGQMKRFENAVGDAGQAIGEIFLPKLNEALEGLNWLLLFNQRVDRSLADHSAKLVETAGSYEEYKDGIWQALLVTKKIIPFQYNAWKAMGLLDNNLQRMAREGLPIYTEEQYNAARAADAHAAALQRQAQQGAAGMTDYQKQLKDVAWETEIVGGLIVGQMGDIQRAAGEAALAAAAAAQDWGERLRALQEIVNGTFGRNVRDFVGQQDEIIAKQAEVMAQIDAMDAKRKRQGGWLSRNDLAQLDELKKQYGDLGDQFTANADKHSEATKRMVFDLLTQKAAVDGISQAEFEFLAKLAEGFGLLDDVTAAAVRDAGMALDALNQGELAVADALVAGILRNLQALPGNYDASVNVQLSGPGANLVRSGAVSVQASGIISGGGVEARANGGPVVAGRPYLVGERGPEMFVPGEGGRVIDARTTQIYRAAPDVSINMAAADPLEVARMAAREITRRM